MNAHFNRILGTGLVLSALSAGAAMAAEKIDGPVGLYFDANTVAAMEAKGGGQLFNMPGKKYRVIAGQHDKPNSAEIHTNAADIVIFTKGKAIVVTGGKVVNPKFPAPGEVVGTAIEGGTDHNVGPGDVIVMLEGTPHWFKSVEGKVEYLTIHLTDLDK